MPIAIFKKQRLNTTPPKKGKGAGEFVGLWWIICHSSSKVKSLVYKIKEINSMVCDIFLRLFVTGSKIVTIFESRHKI